MIEVRHKNRPSFLAPDTEDFWMTMVFGAVVGVLVLGLFGGVALDALWVGGRGMENENAPEGWEFFWMFTWPALTLWVTYPILVFATSKIYPSTYVHTPSQREAVKEFQYRSPAVQKQIRPAYDAFLELRDDDPQYLDARKLFERTVKAADDQEKMLRLRRIDLSNASHNLEALEESNKNLKEMMAHDD